MSVQPRGANVLMDCRVAHRCSWTEQPCRSGRTGRFRGSQWLVAHTIVCCVPPLSRSLAPVTSAASEGYLPVGMSGAINSFCHANVHLPFGTALYYDIPNLSAKMRLAWTYEP